MTEEEYRAKMKSYGWSEREIALRLAEHAADSRDCALPLPLELYLREKGALRTYFVGNAGFLCDKEDL